MGVRGQYEHLDSRQATDEDVLEHLLEVVAYAEEQGAVAMPIDQFWQEGDLGRYWMARDAWAQDVPPRFALPDLPTLLRFIAGPASVPRITFMAYLEMLWKNYATWMASEGRDPAHPTETGRQRAARRARESAARSRELHAKTTDPDRAALLTRDRELYQAYMDACARRKALVAEQDVMVAAAKAAYDAVHAQVKGTPAS